MGKAVQFGAGNIGRGFLGQLFFETGYSTTYVDVVQDLIDQINARKSYPLRIVDEQTYTLTIGDVAALHAGQRDAVARCIAEADIGATAVGVPVLAKVAPLIAAGIELRYQDPNAPPLNVIVCENMIEAGPYLREKVREHLSPACHRALDERVGFVEASIGRMVPVMTDAVRSEDPLLVCVEAYCDLPVDAQGFKGPVPKLKNMQPRSNFGGYVERKLFIHNAGHATTAYLGYLRGHEYTWQAVEDKTVRKEVEAALAESKAGLVKKHGLDPAGLDEHIQDLLQRFANRGLGDQVARVAKDPIRKLGPRDRLIGAATMCIEQGIEPKNLAFAAAAAIRYDHAEDQAAQSVQALYRERGLEGVLTEICQVNRGAHLATLIQAGMQRLQREGWIR
ncbi:MAG: mannitol-1-phosphate 5-dehydrogenase [Candidatus Hydrogenedentes bacterium]|nr:mannitol-1-phosphate 5-dehydrogenase [Candidatus Hydrogenedentota bacterium]